MLGMIMFERKVLKCCMFMWRLLGLVVVGDVVVMMLFFFGGGGVLW